MNEAPICSKCQELVNRYGGPCESILYDVCVAEIDQIGAFYQQAEYQDSLETVVRFLEMKRYIVSTEKDLGKIHLRIHPRSIEHYLHYGIFCWCYGK